MERNDAAWSVRAGAYLRTCARDPESMEEQLRLCRDRAAEMGYTVLDAHVYVDDGISGLVVERSGWSDMTRAVQDPNGPPFAVLLIRDRSRIARDCSLDTPHPWLTPLHAAGVRVECADGTDSALQPVAAYLLARPQTRR